jgi:mRNA interferase MazF
MKEMLERKSMTDNTKKILVRGEVYLADLPEIKDSNVQSGIRPIVIVVNESAGKNSPMIQYIPLTSELKRTDLPVHVILNSGNLKKTSMALGEQINSLDRKRIIKRLGKLSDKDMFHVDRIAMCQLGIDVIEYVNAMNRYMQAVI